MAGTNTTTQGFLWNDGEINLQRWGLRQTMMTETERMNELRVTQREGGDQVYLGWSSTVMQSVVDRPCLDRQVKHEMAGSAVACHK